MQSPYSDGPVGELVELWWESQTPFHGLSLLTMFELVVVILIGTPMLIYLRPWGPAWPAERQKLENANEADAAAMASE